VFGFLKLANGMKDTVVSEILCKVATRLASYKVPERLEILDKLPRNALSKVDRNRLQAMAAKTNEALRPPIAAVSSQPRQPLERPARRVVRIR
jgi:acyl-CoA synthetase (AMP-forming)/AMP-acid ligase II